MTTETQHLFTYWYDNRVAIAGAAMTILSAGIKTAPLPGTPWNFQTLYAWAYDAGHQLFNISNTRPGAQGVNIKP